MQRFAQNPSDILEGHLIYACDPIAASADVSSPATSSGRVDVSDYEYVLVQVITGDTDTALTVQVQESATASGTLVDVSGAVISVAATDDNTMKMIEVRCLGREKYLGLHVTSTGGTTGDYAIAVLGFGRRRTADLSTLTATISEKTLA